MNKTIGFAALFLTLIFWGHTKSALQESVESAPERITLGSVVSVTNPDASVAPFTMPQISDAVVGQPATQPVSGPPRETSIDSAVAAFAGTVVNLENQSVLWERRPLQRHPLASLTKLMTGVVALENIGMEKTITITDEDVRAEGDAAGLKAGETFSVRDLVAAMILSSSNDAADALARFYGTSLFVNAMQQKANDIGMTNTSFFDPSGLSSLNQSTAENVASLVRYIREYYPEIFTLSRSKEQTILEQTAKTPRVIKSINEFAGDPQFLGGKTGYTPEAHGNLVSLFSAGEKTLLIIVLGTDDRFGETRALGKWAKEQ
ncbi:MAG: serine hydrolase [bacterium]|nr:serine hydrolase [bacterium]